MPIDGVSEKFGGAYLQELHRYAFFGAPGEGFQQALDILYVDALKLRNLLAVSSANKFSIGGLKEEEDPVGVYWRFLKGPRKPIQIPTMSFSSGSLLFNGYESDGGAQTPCNVRALLDWRAPSFPVLLLARPRDLELVRELVGYRTRPETFPSTHYLPAVRDVLLAFQGGRSPADIFQEMYRRERGDKSYLERIVRGVEDFAELTRLQLDIMSDRHTIRTLLGSMPMTEDNPNVRETCRALHQERVLAEWLSGTRDPAQLPYWNAYDKCSVEEAAQFYAKCERASRVQAAAAQLTTPETAARDVAAGNRTAFRPTTDLKSRTLFRMEKLALRVFENVSEASDGRAEPSSDDPAARPNIGEDRASGHEAVPSNPGRPPEKSSDSRRAVLRLVKPDHT